MYTFGVFEALLPLKNSGNERFSISLILSIRNHPDCDGILTTVAGNASTISAPVIGAPASGPARLCSAIARTRGPVISSFFAPSNISSLIVAISFFSASCDFFRFSNLSTSSIVTSSSFAFFVVSGSTSREMLRIRFTSDSRIGNAFSTRVTPGPFGLERFSFFFFCSFSSSSFFLLASLLGFFPSLLLFEIGPAD